MEKYIVHYNEGYGSERLDVFNSVEEAVLHISELDDDGLIRVFKGVELKLVKTYDLEEE